MSRSKVVLRSVNKDTMKREVLDVLERLDYRAVIREGARVVIKVNLSTPFKDMAPASNTSPDLLDAVCAAVRPITDRIWVGESNGMRYATEEAFEVSGYYPILEKHGVTPINFSKDEWVDTGNPMLKGWGLSKTLLSADVVISLPVLKTHATTVFTGTLKNQFGCYPQHDRILLHPKLDRAIVAINEILRPGLVIMDGVIAMEGRGPINGKPRELGVILASRDIVALDATAMRLVGLDPDTCKHLCMAAHAGLGSMNSAEIEVEGPYDNFRCEFEPAEKDLPIKMLGLISRSRFLTKNLVLNPESFYPLRSAAIMFRQVRDFLFGGFKPRRTN